MFLFTQFGNASALSGVTINIGVGTFRRATLDCLFDRHVQLLISMGFLWMFGSYDLNVASERHPRAFLTRLQERGVWVDKKLLPNALPNA